MTSRLIPTYVAFLVHVEGEAQPRRIDIPLTGSEITLLGSVRPEDQDARRNLETKLWSDFIRRTGISGEKSIVFSRCDAEFNRGGALEGVPLEAAFA